MYNVRSTTEAPSGAHVRCTTYDVRLPNSRALRGAAEQVRAGCPKAVIGRGYKGAGRGQTGTLPMYEVRRRRLAAPMYDVRFSMYDCDYSALCAGRGQTGTLPMYDGRRRRLAAPMYEVRCTTEADGACLCTTYDVRCTIAIIARVARDGGRRRRLAAPMYEVRCTMYDCDVRAPCAEIWRSGRPLRPPRQTH